MERQAWIQIAYQTDGVFSVILRLIIRIFVRYNSMSNIVFLDRSALSANIQIPLVRGCSHWRNYLTTSPAKLVEHIGGAEVLVLSKVPISKESLAACPRVKHIAVMATGYNIIDLDACKQYGVSVSNVPSYAATSVSEHVISVALCLRRELIQYRAQVIDGAWQRSPAFCLFDKPVNDLAASTFGVIGFGELGKATAKLAHGLGMNVVFCARSPQTSEYATQLSFNEVISNADIISVHCSLNPSTENLINTTQFKRMKSSAILINTARGGIVNEADLVDAIEANQIGGVGLDVLRHEPPGDNEPLLRLASRTNVIITPHSAWLSEQSMQSCAAILADNIEAYLSGNPINLVPLTTNT
ncbi:MAG: glycerate dehydrogenase [Arenicella sp.]